MVATIETFHFIQIWNINNGQSVLKLQGIEESKKLSILCINLSEENNRLIASATSGLVVVSEIRMYVIVINRESRNYGSK